MLVADLQTNIASVSSFAKLSKTPTYYRYRYSRWPEFKQKPRFTASFFQTECVHNMEFSITGLVSMQKEWMQSRNFQCRHMFEKFITLYSLEGRKASVKIPKLFEVKVRKWLGNNSDLLKEVYNQDVVHVVSRFTREHTIFNPLRDKRPVLPLDVSEKTYLDKMVQKTRKSCDFCNYEEYTSEHTFGRVESKYAFSASNIFKLDTLHSLLALKSHHPLSWTYIEYMDLMNLTLTWLGKAKVHYPDAKYPSLIWDVLPKCGASQVHPHMHVVFDPERYHGNVENWRLGAQDYFDKTGSNYFTDLVATYTLLDLTVSYGDAVAFANLVPKKDHEVVVMANSPSQDFFTLLYFVLRGFVDDLGMMCYSMGIGLPPLGCSEGRIPAYARVITRGAITDIRADMSSLELFMATNVNIDPYKTVEIVRNSVSKRRQRS